MGLHPLWTQIQLLSPALSIISGCPWAVAMTEAVAAVCQLLEEFKIVFAEANLLNKQKPKVENFW